MKSLNILIVTQAPWFPRFGAVKVHIDIKEEYERMGHKVEKISLDDLYPKGQNIVSKIFGKLYTEYIYEFLKANAYRFDIIDANFSCVIYPKESFGFKGVLLARSHGIGPIYKWAEQNIERYKQALAVNPKQIKLKTRIGNIYRAVQKKAGMKEFELSVKYADLVHCLNKSEYEYFKQQAVPEKKLLLLPNGIPDKFISKMNSSLTNNRENSICFIGAWNVRKGINDLDEIISLIDQRVQLKKVMLLGGQFPIKVIESFFSKGNKLKIAIIPDFDKSELITYVGCCKVGMFPSFVEGHPLAILEQLSIGIPVVSYKVPGTTDIIEDVDDTLLVSPGDRIGFANKVTEILELDPERYKLLVSKCKDVSRNYLLSTITNRLMENYSRCLLKDFKADCI